MSEESVEIVEGAIRLWNQGDRAGFLAAFHPDGQWSSAIQRQVEGGEAIYRGREEIGRFWDEWHAVWPDLTVVFSEVRSHANWVLAFGEIQGTGTGSGVGLERPLGWVFRVKDELILEARAYLNRQETLDAAGLSE